MLIIKIYVFLNVLMGYYIEPECIISVNCCIYIVGLQRTAWRNAGIAKSFERNAY